jgi:hypothetical protein
MDRKILNRVFDGLKLRCATSKAAGAFTARISTFGQNCVPKTDSLVYGVSPGDDGKDTVVRGFCARNCGLSAL